MAVLLSWVALAAVLLALAGALLAAGPSFDWSLPVEQMPAAALALGCASAGLGYLLAVPLSFATARAPARVQRLALGIIAIAGLAARLVLLPSEPALEDDYHRYLWEGALTFHGFNPYRVSPETARSAEPLSTLARLVQDAGPVLDRINHPRMTSTYPPVALAAFAAAYALSPWSLTAWRVVSLACDVATALLILVLLQHAGRPLHWVALYWWNPVVIKELVNSAHMEAVLMMLVLAALWLLARRRHHLALLALGLAAATKLWPAFLAPMLMRALPPRPRPIAMGLGLLIAPLAVMAWLGAFQAGGGLAAYAERWRTNSAIASVYEVVARRAGALVGLPQGAAWLAVWLLVILAIAGLALWISRRPTAGAGDIMSRAGLLALAVVLLSPVQFPWYLIWMIPFLPFRPRLAGLAAVVTVPLYYLSFHFMARGSYSIFTTWIVWAIWLPVWLALAVEGWSAWRGGARPDRG